MSENQERLLKKRFRNDGSSVWTRRNIDGPGVWLTCVKGKERQAIGETYDLFESLTDELWPTDSDANDDEDSKQADGQEDLEKAISREIEIIKRPRKDKWFANCQTNTPCLVFISCKPPVDPVALVSTHVKRVEETGVTHTRSTLRLTPVTNSCDANLSEITSLCKRIAVPVFEKGESGFYRYKIEIRMRNHSTLSREEIIRAIAQCIPERHKVDLQNPELFILVEIFKATCGMSVVRDYYKYKKFNVVELSQARLAVNNDE
ncbi:hypothetical protein A7U60_g1045 [Sanghuangporus baumii]|uniref:THUMP domain-containing protein n=1 Tax=Sanghuangporus baumii TaxID=108892 RepID=A0A9Q5I4V4_SANBA|nr:hypothetical protein A7U60_g1045 [Sanghuangporus baumii]